MNESSESREQSSATGENNPQPQQKEKSQPTPDLKTTDKRPVRYRVEVQWKNLLYKENLGFVPMRKDPRYSFYGKDKTKKFDIKNEDVLHCLEQLNLLQHIELCHDLINSSK